jgi:hypothetical protein
MEQGTVIDGFALQCRGATTSDRKQIIRRRFR